MHFSRAEVVGASTKSCHWLGKVVRASEFHNSVGCNGGGVDMLNKILVLKHFTPGLFVAFLWFYKQTGGSSYDHSIEILMQHSLTFIFKIYFVWAIWKKLMLRFITKLMSINNIKIFYQLKCNKRIMLKMLSLKQSYFSNYFTICDFLWSLFMTFSLFCEKVVFTNAYFHFFPASRK